MKQNEDSMKIDRISVAETVAKHILERIESGAYQQGEPLPTEKEFTELFGVGRSSVREALRALQSLGVIEKRQGNGTFVKSASVSRESCFHIANVLQRYSIIELSEARKIIEEQTAALSAQNASPEHIAAMREANERLRENIACGDRGAVVELDFQVHRAVAEGAGNMFLVEMLDMLLEIVEEFNEEVLTREKVEIALHFHDEIIERIAAADAKGARRLMSEHLTDVHQRILTEQSGRAEQARR